MIQQIKKQWLTIALVMSCTLMMARIALAEWHIEKVAGTAEVSGYSGDNGPATACTFDKPRGVTVDTAGSIYIADNYNHAVRKVDAGATIAAFAGTGSSGYTGDGGAATAAELRYPLGTAIDSSGNLYIADTNNHCIRKVAANGVITTVAGTGDSGYSGDNGPATAAELYYPAGIVLDGSGGFYIADRYNHRIRKVAANGTITTFAGTGSSGYSGDNGPAAAAELDSPYGIALDKNGALYIADTRNERIRKVDASGTITTVAGNGSAGYEGDNGPAAAAKLSNPLGVAADDQGALYISDSNNDRIRKVNPAGIITTLAGTGNSGYSGDNGPALSAQLNEPHGIAVDKSGSVYFADARNEIIRRVYDACIDTDGDGFGENCDPGPDNCPATVNSQQLDADGDGIGDACDATPGCGLSAGCGQPICEYIDTDTDGKQNYYDNCPDAANPRQLDGDGDGIGDACDATPGCGGGCGQPACEALPDSDNDFTRDAIDNCPTICNAFQLDADNDGTGDVCDSTPACGGSDEPVCEAICTM
ncbi:MAG: thrombospondin type 3 repeat-containing protein [Deltaproteobacteria bacterium]|nr:thrombospondin type 3 repeat-containing protein [Deltaproteobacteria bacterium]